MGAGREVFWALAALVGAFVVLFAVLLWVRLARREGEARRARAQRGDLLPPDDEA